MSGEPPLNPRGTGAERTGPLLPRKMALEELIRTLLDEHAAMKEGIRKGDEAVQKRDFQSLARTLRELDPLFRQHIVDEESTILRMLVAQLGVKGAEEEIRVFQQHRPIYQLMRKVADFASMSGAELEENQEALKDLFDRHAEAEERRVFPRAASLSTR